MTEKRNTVQKQAVTKAVRELNHPTADAVYRRVSDSYPQISKATVYRIMNNMCAEGELMKVSIPEAADIYDITVSNHCHIRCRICGGVYDISAAPFEQALCGERDGFAVEGFDILFRGVCPECINKI